MLLKHPPQCFWIFNLKNIERTNPYCDKRDSKFTSNILRELNDFIRKRVKLDGQVCHVVNLIVRNEVCRQFT